MTATASAFLTASWTAIVSAPAFLTASWTAIVSATAFSTEWATVIVLASESAYGFGSVSESGSVTELTVPQLLVQ